MVRHPDRTIRMTICKREMRNRRAIRSLPFQDFAIRVEYVFHPFEDNVQIGEIDERWEHLDIALAKFNPWVKFVWWALSNYYKTNSTGIWPFSNPDLCAYTSITCPFHFIKLPLLWRWHLPRAEDLRLGRRGLAEGVP